MKKKHELNARMKMKHHLTYYRKIYLKRIFIVTICVDIIANDIFHHLYVYFFELSYFFFRCYFFIVSLVFVLLLFLIGITFILKSFTSLYFVCIQVKLMYLT